MSDLIRTQKKSFLPLPKRTIDIRHAIPRDVYSFVQNQIESQQRQEQSNMNRLIRASRDTTPRSTVRPDFTINVPGLILTVPLTTR
jgi:hypothetical protein